MKPTFVFLVLFYISRIGFACSCAYYEPNFYKSISESSFICLAVFDTTDYGYEYQGGITETGYFVLIDTIGNFGSQIGDTIVVTGQDGVNCGDSFYTFTKGDTVFLSLSNGFWEPYIQDTFYLDGCSKNYLRIKNKENSHLSISEIKDKIKKVLENQDLSCHCPNYYWEPQGFYNNTSIETSNCLAVFNRFDYAYSHNGLHSQTGYFILIDTIANINSRIGDTLIVIGEDGINCGEILNSFSNGDTLFLALSDGFYEDFAKDTFYLKGGNCGYFYLKVTNNKNDGLSIPEIKNKIKSIISGIESDLKYFDLNIYPNPTGSKFSINANGAIIKGMQVFDIEGKLIFEDNQINSYDFEGDMTHNKNGLYHIIIKTDKGDIKKSIIKN